MKGLGRKTRRMWVTALVVAAVATACSSNTAATTTTSASPASTTTTSAAPTTTTEAAPAELTIGMGLLPPSGVPWTGVGSPGQYVWSNIFDALTYVAPDGSVAPALATSWEAVDDTHWRFHLRQGVTFQNGEPFNADAVVATFKTLLSEEGRSTYSANVNNYSFVTEVTKVDDSTVEVVTKTPNPLVPAVLSIAYIVPPAYFAQAGAEGFASAPVGTGPYESTEFSDQKVVLTAWDGSWRDKPSIGQLTFLNLNDPAARLQALQSGQVDVAESISPDQIGNLKNAGFQVFSGTRGSVMSLAFITNKGGPLEKQEVRQALNYAVDKKTIVDQLLGGVVSPGVWAPEGVNGYDPGRQPYPYDAAKAKQLLADAGYPNGFDMTAEITVGSFPADADIYEAMKGYLADIGVNVELKQIDFAGDWLPKFLGRDGANWTGNAFGLSWNAAPLMDAIRPFNFYSCNWSNQYFCDQDAQKLIDQVNSTFDVAQRNTLLGQLLQRTWDNPPALWLVVTPELWGYRSGVNGFKVSNFNIKFEDVTVSS